MHVVRARGLVIALLMVAAVGAAGSPSFTIEATGREDSLEVHSLMAPPLDGQAAAPDPAGLALRDWSSPVDPGTESGPFVSLVATF